MKSFYSVTMHLRKSHNRNPAEKSISNSTFYTRWLNGQMRNSSRWTWCQPEMQYNLIFIYFPHLRQTFHSCPKPHNLRFHEMVCDKCVNDGDYNVKKKTPEHSGKLKFNDGLVFFLLFFSTMHCKNRNHQPRLNKTATTS